MATAAMNAAINREQRADVVSRLEANLSSLLFFSGRPIAGATAYSTAVSIEKRAFTTSEVESRTTTGLRPAEEVRKAYIRKLAQLVVDYVASGKGAAGSGDIVHGETLDLSRGQREFLTSDMAEDALEAMLLPGSHLVAIKFSTKSFGVEAAEVAARGIENTSGVLKRAHVSDIIAGRPEDEALQVLSIITNALSKCQLTVLDLSDNALGEKGVRACSQVLISQKHLQELAFQNVGCSIKACQALDELVASTSLRRLHLYNNMSDDDGALAIASLIKRCPHMEDFRMASSRVGSEGGVALAEALYVGTSLQQLDLSDNPMDCDLGPPLGVLVQRHPNLRVLNLNDTCLSDEGIENLAHALCTSGHEIEDLGLALNDITADGLKPLLPALARKSKLRALSLRENELGDGGTTALARALVGLTALQRLDLSGNQITKTGAMAAAACVSRSKPEFSFLGLDENHISEQGVEQVSTALGMAFPDRQVLGPMDENDPDGADDAMDDEDDEAEEPAGSGADAGGLSDMLSGMAISKDPAPTEKDNL